MKKGIIGKKIGMTQIFDEIGNVIPVTVIQAGPCVVAQKKTAENDGYEAVQVGFDVVRGAALVNEFFDYVGHVAGGVHAAVRRMDDGLRTLGAGVTGILVVNHREGNPFDFVRLADFGLLCCRGVDPVNDIHSSMLPFSSSALVALIVSKVYTLLI